jgi:hypothetical protein
MTVPGDYPYVDGKPDGDQDKQYGSKPLSPPGDYAARQSDRSKHAYQCALYHLGLTHRLPTWVGNVSYGTYNHYTKAERCRQQPDHPPCPPHRFRPTLLPHHRHWYPYFMEPGYRIVA